MKKLACFLFLIFLISLFFNCRDFEDFDNDVLYVFEDYENGVITSSVYNDNCVSQCMEISIDEIENFIEYFDVQLLSTYNVDDVKVINGYSKYLEKKLPYKNGCFNLQLAISDKVLVGYPQLYQGF